MKIYSRSWETWVPAEPHQFLAVSPYLRSCLIHSPDPWLWERLLWRCWLECHLQAHLGTASHRLFPICLSSSSGLPPALTTQAGSFPHCDSFDAHSRACSRPLPLPLGHCITSSSFFPEGLGAWLEDLPWAGSRHQGRLKTPRRKGRELLAKAQVGRWAGH